jgi:hypothetical protein
MASISPASVGRKARFGRWKFLSSRFYRQNRLFKSDQQVSFRTTCYADAARFQNRGVDSKYRDSDDCR